MTNLIAGKFGDQVSPRQALINALNECDSYEQVVIVVKDKENDILLSWSYGNSTEHIGMMQFAVYYFCKELSEAE